MNALEFFKQGVIFILKEYDFFLTISEKELITIILLNKDLNHYSLDFHKLIPFMKEEPETYDLIHYRVCCLFKSIYEVSN